MSPRPLVGLGLVGTQLDRGPADAARWERWRPSVALCQHPDLLLARFELLHPPEAEGLARQVADDLALVSPETAVRLHPITFADAWDFEGVYGALHDFARGYAFDPEREEYLVHITTGTHVAQICLFLLTEARFFPARLVQTSPPRGGHAAVGSYRVIDLDLSKYDRLAAREEQRHAESRDFLKSGIATRNAAFNRLIDEIERVALHSRAPILLHGPTGAGKSQLARRIYALKKARGQLGGAFVEVNCATLRGDQAASALFGHTRGAFTGAVKDRAGLLRAADGGILFLDEIGELGLDEQAMLLRALEEKLFLPVGADRDARSDFQLIAGTNRDLHDSVRAGTFRDDLLARINLWTYTLPGLAQRREDVEPNLDYELAGFARQAARRVRFSAEARARFLRFATAPEAAWTANFRDLNAAVTRMATLAPGGRITEEVVDEEVERLRRHWRGADRVAGDVLLEAVLGPEKAAALDRFDRVQLADVLAVCREARSLSEAGRTLFAHSRQKRATTNDADRLRKYLARFGLAWEAVQP
jgi:transcriptional regulatory protein RtcR